MVNAINNNNDTNTQAQWQQEATAVAHQVSSEPALTTRRRSEYLDLGALEHNWSIVYSDAAKVGEKLADSLKKDGVTNVVLSFEQLNQLQQDGYNIVQNINNPVGYWENQPPTGKPSEGAGEAQNLTDALSKNGITITLSFGGVAASADNFLLPAGADGKNYATNFYHIMSTKYNITSFDFDVESPQAASSLTNQSKFMQQLKKLTTANNGTMTVTLECKISTNSNYMNLIKSGYFTDLNFMAYSTTGATINIKDYYTYAKAVLDKIKGEINTPTTIHFGFQDGSNYPGSSATSNGTNAADQYKALQKDFLQRYPSLTLGPVSFWPAEKKGTPYAPRYQPSTLDNWDFNDIKGTDFENDFNKELPTAFRQPAPLDSKTISTLSYITKKVVADAFNAPSGIDATSFESSLPTTEETRNTNSPSTKELDKQSSIKEEEHLKEIESQCNHLSQSALQG